MAEYPRYHFNCGGQLVFDHTEVENRVVNKRAVDRFGAKAIIKRISKTLYKCRKCGDLVNIITFPSWEEYVLMGQIRVDPRVYWAIKNRVRKEQEAKRNAQR